MVAYHAYTASRDLAAERGRYESFNGSKWDRGLLLVVTFELLERKRGIPVQVERTARLDWAALCQRIKRLNK